MSATHSPYLKGGWKEVAERAFTALLPRKAIRCLSCG